jgi:hypothetical protein
MVTQFDVQNLIDFIRNAPAGQIQLSEIDVNLSFNTAQEVIPFIFCIILSQKDLNSIHPCDRLSNLVNTSNISLLKAMVLFL